MRHTLIIALTAVLMPVAQATRALAETPASNAGDAARTDIQKTLGFVPGFLKMVPDRVIPGFWDEMKSLQMSPNTAIPTKIKELIGLAVAAQVPCEYCVQAHTEFAKLNGATKDEIGEAVALGGLTRHWSTFFNGIALDEARFRTDVARLVEGAKKAAASKMAPPPALEVIDLASARKDIEQSFGFYPEFLKAFPDEALPGAWKELRDVEFSDKTAIAPKYKSLIGLAVAAQIPCHYCVVADTEFAKLGGATDREMHEAVAMASFTRNASTVLNGLQIDQATFKKDIMRLVDGAKKKSSKQAAR